MHRLRYSSADYRAAAIATQLNSPVAADRAFSLQKYKQCAKNRVIYTRVTRITAEQIMGTICLALSRRVIGPNNGDAYIGALFAQSESACNRTGDPPVAGATCGT